LLHLLQVSDEVKRIHVNMRVDTGSMYMFINENIQEQLQLAVLEKRKGQLAKYGIQFHICP